MRILVTAALLLLVVSLPATAAPTAPEEGCDLRPLTIEQGVTTDGVVGVVERRTLARNPLPWGTSVSVATRIWGDILAERWVVSARSMAECPRRPALDVGTITYDFRGAEAEWSGGYSEVWLDEPLPVTSALHARFGEPTDLAVGSADRAMAWLRVATTEVAALVGGAVALVISVARRRVRRRRDRHLF